MRHHDEVTIKTRAVVGIQKGRAVPSFRDTEFKNVRGQGRGIALVFPQVIGAEICKYENGPNNGYDRKRPVRSELIGNSAFDLHSEADCRLRS